MIWLAVRLVLDVIAMIFFRFFCTFLEKKPILSLYLFQIAYLWIFHVGSDLQKERKKYQLAEFKLWAIFWSEKFESESHWNVTFFPCIFRLTISKLTNWQNTCQHNCFIILFCLWKDQIERIYDVTVTLVPIRM